MGTRLATRITIAAFAPIVGMTTAPAQELIREHLGPAGGGYLGRTVTAVVDLDGDGVRDYAIGDLDYVSYGNVRIHSGADGSILFSILGSTSGTFGSAIAAGGDFDGDGIADLLIGDPRFDDPNQPYYWEGAVRIYSGASGVLLKETFGTKDDHEFGTSVGGLDDLDRDGTPDLLVLAYDRAVYSFSVSAISGSDGHTIYDVDFDHPSAIVVGADRDGDGMRDFLIGSNFCPCSDGGSHDLAAISAATGATLYKMSIDVAINTLAETADLDGDGAPEVLAGGFGGSGWGGGDGGFTGAYESIDVCSLAAAAVIRVHHEAWFASSLGDEDGDGFDDYLVGCRSVGRVHVVSGRSGEQLYGFAPTDTGPVQGLGDVDGDGHPDFVVGAPDYVDVTGVRRGRVSVHSGNDLWLDADLEFAVEGDYEVLTARGVPAGNPMGIAVVRWHDGICSPLFQFLAIVPADKTEAMTLEGTVPAGLAGVVGTFQGFAIGRSGRVIDSARETIEFQ